MAAAFTAIGMRTHIGISSSEEAGVLMSGCTGRGRGDRCPSCTRPTSTETAQDGPG
jgi:hypothetical protein